MNSAIVSALAALAGSALGAITPITTNFLIQKGQTQREILTRDLALRQDLYAQFIQASARAYASAITTNLEKLDDVVDLYAYIGRMRLISSQAVIDAADAVVKRIISRFGEPNLTVDDVRNAAVSGQVDPLSAFSLRCREEMRSIIGHPAT